MGVLRGANVFKRFAKGGSGLFGGAKPEAPGVSPEELQPLLITLLEEPTLETTAAKNVIAELKSIASRCGTFLTASEIQRALSEFDFKSEDGRRLKGTRAYELAAKLHWEYIHKEIDQMNKKSRRLGSTVYAVFVEEMIECLLRGEDPLKAIEIPVVLADELLGRVFEPSPYTGTYFILAERTIAAAHDGYKYWIDGKKHILELDHKLNDPSGPMPDEAFFAEADEVVQYLSGLERALHALSEELGEIQYEPDASRAGDEMRASFHGALLGVARRASYAPFTAMVLERTAHSQNGAANAEGRQALIEEAAALYAEQAEAEERMHMPILSERRMKEARRIQAL
jgi:hypothetical protein